MPEREDLERPAVAARAVVQVVVDAAQVDTPDTCETRVCHPHPDEGLLRQQAKRTSQLVLERGGSCGAVLVPPVRRIADLSLCSSRNKNLQGH